MREQFLNFSQGQGAGQLKRVGLTGLEFVFWPDK
jgi:hypothetical protein